MDYQICVTDAGRYLIARLLTGQTMHISKIMVGSGKVDQSVRIASLTNLLRPVAQATSNDPQCDGGIAYMTIEYNNSLNGGLETGFWLNEFGVFAVDPVEGEIMLAYGTLGDYPQYIVAYDSGRGVDVRRFPISIAIGEDRGMVVDYRTDLWLTWDDLANYLNMTIMPLIQAEVENGIAAHNSDPNAHFGFERILNTKVYPRIALAEAMEEYSELSSGDHSGYENEYIVTFETLTGVTVTGNYVHDDFLCRIDF